MLFSKKKQYFFFESKKGLTFLAQGSIKISPNFKERPNFYMVFNLLQQSNKTGGLLFCNLETNEFYGINKSLSKLWSLEKEDFSDVSSPIELEKLIVTEKEEYMDKIFQNKTIDMEFNIQYIIRVVKNKKTTKK